MHSEARKSKDKKGHGATDVQPGFTGDIILTISLKILKRPHCEPERILGLRFKHIRSAMTKNISRIG